ncbi:MAG: RagB/SusD family nutrient uptake outer membrane protein [Bacteroidales bacterium]|nr:RagB/SusD family nutrient uptake outer membrane protein [Bacteroidales bacterium]MBQ6871624.1 RagB/SusD family nutrient uptake outer membrane protein [Bacteroidales bacterium]
MKKFYNIFILSVIMVASLASCERPFLEPWPPDAARTEQDVWDTYDFTKGMVDIIYADQIMCPYVYDVYGSGNPGYGMLASATDEAEHSESGGAVQMFTNGVWNPTNMPKFLFGGPWNSGRFERYPYLNSYVGIRRANLFLSNVHKSDLLIDDPSDPTKAKELTYFKGQTYFWRALLQFWLLRAYGRFVISTEPEDPSDTEYLFRPRNTIDECVAQIVKDCDAAIDSLPTLWDEANWHRANRTAAQALKSRALLYYASPLYQGNWEGWGAPKNTTGDVQRWIDAADAAREAINDNDFYNLTPVTKFTRPYSASGTYNYVTIIAQNMNNRELIFGTGKTTYYSQQNEYYSLPAGVDGCKGWTNPTQEMVDEFEVVTGTGADRKAVPFDWNNPEHAKDPYANRDIRFYSSINYNGKLWGTSSSKAYYIDTYEGGVHRNRLLTNSTKTGYYYCKFLNESYYANKTGYTTTTSRQRHEFRFAELVLNYAEAMNEAYGPYGEDPKGALRIDGINTAEGAINAVRARVNMPPLEKGLSKDQMRDKIKHERWVELCFEGHRFYDLRRWKEGDKLGAPIHGIVITPTGFDSKNRPTGFTYKVEKVEDRVWRDCMYWWPIPQEEIVKYPAGNFEQNPGW